MPETTPITVTFDPRELAAAVESALCEPAVLAVLQPEQRGRLAANTARVALSRLSDLIAHREAEAARLQQIRELQAEERARAVARTAAHERFDALRRGLEQFTWLQQTDGPQSLARIESASQFLDALRRCWNTAKPADVPGLD
jgi:hypothetical protein